MSESPIQLRGKSGGVVFDGTQSPGGGSQPLTEQIAQLAPNPVSDDTSVNAAVQHNAGDALLDYTDPAAPTVLAAGLYAVTLQAGCFEGPQAGGTWSAGVILTGTVLTTDVAQDGPLTSGETLSGPLITVTAIGPLTAGDTITFPMSSYSGTPGTLNLNVVTATVVKLA